MTSRTFFASAYFLASLLLATKHAGAIVYYSTNYTPGSVTKLYAACTYGGYAIPGASISLSNTYIAYSNSHLHDPSSSGHGSSTYSPSSGTSDSTGNLTVYLDTTIIGQDEATTEQCTLPSPYPTTPYNVGPFYFTVGYADIYYTDASNMYKTGASTNHGSVYYNRYMTTTAGTGLYNAVSDYLAYYTDTPTTALGANDQSLPYGGVFDLNANWVPPHQEHYRGVAGDIRGNDTTYSVPVSRQSAFGNYCTLEGANYILIEFPTAGDNDTSVGDARRHIHCRWPFVP